MARTAGKAHAALEARWQTILTKLKANEQHLWNQGTLAYQVAQGRRIWSIRFFVRDTGHKVHRAIYVGGDDQVELLDRVRGFLAELRQPQSWRQEMATLVRWAKALKRAVVHNAGKNVNRRSAR